MRKDLDLDVEANIQVFVDCSVQFRDLIKNFLGFITHEVRADKFVFGKYSDSYSKEWIIEDEKLVITIKLLK